MDTHLLNDIARHGAQAVCKELGGIEAVHTVLLVTTHLQQDVGK
jgi:hypothetical protein